MLSVIVRYTCMAYFYHEVFDIFIIEFPDSFSDDLS